MHSTKQGRKQAVKAQMKVHYVQMYFREMLLVAVVLGF